MDATGTIALAGVAAGAHLSERAATLTLEQEQAVARRAEPLAVSAAAGSGKTSVLVERFVRALREDSIAPGRILAITFTERAAGELRARVRARLLDLGERQAARDTEAAFIGTFHAFCARLLRAHPLAVGIDPDFEILDEGLAARLRELAFAEAARATLATADDGERSAAVDLLAAYGVDRVRTIVEQAYLELRSTGQRFPRLPVPAVPPSDDDDAAATQRDARAVRVCALLDELLERFGVAYEQGKRARTSVDFDDLELLAQELLADSEPLRAIWSERFELLMVDEFQDTNARQLSILRALQRRNLFTVGDEFQSIYGFRHADVRIFRERAEELAGAGGSLALTHNFRSRAALLDVVNGVFSERFSGFEALRAGRDRQLDAAVEVELDVESESAAAVEPAVELLLTNAGGWQEGSERALATSAGLPPAPLWRQAEAGLLARRIAELVDEGRASAGEIVVLLRATGDIEVFERALQLRGLRTLAAVGAFWGQQQIGDLLAYLRALANPLDEEALYGVLASPLAGCSRDCLALLALNAQAVRRSVWETAVEAVANGQGGLPVQGNQDGPGGRDDDGERLLTRFAEHDRAALARACELLANERAAVPRRTVAELIERAIEATGYRAHVLTLDWGERRLANVHKLLRLARRFEAGEGRDLRAFLDHVARLRDAAAIEPDAPVEGVEPDAVRLMTIHAAKGLEFPVVCVADLGRQPNLRTPDLLVDGERVGIRLTQLDDGDSTPALDYQQLSVERRGREADEEDRVFYVAMTRARDLLVLSGAVDFARWPRPGPSAPPISWIAPALSPELPQLLSSGASELADVVLDGESDGRVRIRLDAGSVPLPEPPEPPPPIAAERLAPSGLERRQASERRQQTEQVTAAPEATSGQSPELRECRAAPAAGGGERFSTLSYSSLSELERCAYRFYLERVLGLAEDRAAGRAASGERGLEARARGTLVHAVMESLDFAAGTPPSVESVSSQARALGLRLGRDERDELAELLEKAARAAPASRIAKARNVRREHPFAFSLGDGEPLITGVIDLLALDADGVHVVLDYKSDRVAADVELESLVEREYAIQRRLYALAVLREGASSVEIVHWFLEREESVAASYRSADRADLERELSARIARARQTRFAVSAAPHRGLCLTCPGRSGLCSWGEAETLRESPGDAIAGV
ncbi:MAG TPA: UvrD-helicase domain-containing protein [Solirubrobacteraceae bacterium]|nr:UvrD-helicase domain-containing protein [Solirubrobacteraceae bacterium]